MTASAKPKRWMQFKLRTLLIGLVVCGLALGFIGREVSRVRAWNRNFRAMQEVFYKLRDYEPRALEWHVGANIADLAYVPRSYYDTDPMVAIWARHYAHSPPTEPSSYWGLEHSNVRDADLVHLRPITPGGEVTGINLANTPVGDAGLAQISQHAGLRVLILDSTAITGDGLQHLHSLQRLRYLSLNETKVPPDSIEKLQLTLPHCWITR